MTKEKINENMVALELADQKKTDKGIADKELETEVPQRLERFKTIAKAIGEDTNVEVAVGEERGWRYYFKPLNKIEVDPYDIKEKDLDQCLGLVAHEAAHRKISRIDFIPKKIWQAKGFSFLMNAVEDPRVNNWVSEKYDGADEWLEKVYNAEYGAEGKLADTAENKLGYVPDHIKYGLEVIQYWHTGKFSDDLSPKIQQTLDQTIKYAELAYNSVPVERPAENEINEKAQTAYKIVYSAIWPHYEKLVDKSFEDEKLRQLINDLAESGDLEIPPEAQADSPESSDTEKEEGEKDNGEKGQVKKEVKFKDLPEDLKNKLREKVKEILDQLPLEQREKIEEQAEQKAKKNLDELEGDLNQELKGHLVEQPKTKLEEEKEKTDQAKKEEQEKKSQAEVERVKKAIEEKLASEKTSYDKAYQEVKPYIDKVTDDIINLFAAKRFPKFKKSFPGQKLRLEGAREWTARHQYKNLFERRLSDQRPDVAFLLLIDLSGSMDNQKIEEAFKAAVLFAESLNKAESIIGGIKVEIHGFQDDLIEYKKPDQRLDQSLREKMSQMKLEVKDQGRHNKASYNNDGFCLDKAAKKLSQTQTKDQFLIVLSDGEPCGDNKHRVPRYKKLSQQEELKAVVREISASGRQKILAIGLGPGTEHVQFYYDNKLANTENIVEDNIHQLSDTLSKKLEKLIIK